MRSADHDFMMRKSTTYVMFALSMLMEKHSEGQRAGVPPKGGYQLFFSKANLTLLYKCFTKIILVDGRQNLF